MTGLPTLTVPQPWAGLVAVGVQSIITRPAPTPHRGRIGIHAGARRHRSGFVVGDWCIEEMTNGTWAAVHHADGMPGAPERIELPFSALVATAELVDCMLVHGDGRGAVVHRWVGGGEAESDITDQLPLGDFTPGRYAWLLDNIAPTTDRCPACWGSGSYPVVTRQLCPVCDGAGRCGPVPAKGRQRLWSWTPGRRETLAVVADWHDEEIEAIKRADLLADKAATGEHPEVPLYDWAAEDDNPATLPRAVPDAWRPAAPGLGRWRS